MHSRLFVRPNLKLFVLAGFLLIVVAEVIQPGRSEVPVFRVHGRELGSQASVQEELHRLTEQARVRPTAVLCGQIAECHRQLRNYPEAIRWLRRAEKIGFTEDDVD